MEMATPTSKLRLEDTMVVSDGPVLVEVETSDNSIPIIDLAGPKRCEVVQQIRLACLGHGVFQVKNHGIPTSLISDMLGVAKEFFKLPESEREKWYSGNQLKSANPSGNSSAKDTIWKDFLWIQCYPIEDFTEGWPSSPSTFRPVVSEYSKSVRDLALNSLKAISESLSLEGDYIEKALGKQAQLMVINYYPSVQRPAFGVPGHKDPNAISISILLQDDASGLQAFHNGKWVPVHPIPDTFNILIGDQIEVISNGRYKSVLHHVLLNPNKERISIPTFYSPSPEAVMEPAEVLGDEHHL